METFSCPERDTCFRVRDSSDRAVEGEPTINEHLFLFKYY